MPYLLFVTVLWAFSFSLIGEYLAGQVDSYFAVLTRVVLAGLVFLPLTSWRGVDPRFIGGVMLVGALQFGITYVCLYQSFRVLTVPEVLLFTVLTPLHVALIDDALNRRFNAWALLAAAVAVLGAGIIRYDGVSGDYVQGFLLLQLANATFAAGQVFYKHLVQRYPSDILRLLLRWCAADCAAGLAAVRQSAEAAEYRRAMGGAGVDGPAGHRARAVLVEQGRHDGGCRYSGGDEQPACSGRTADQPVDLE